MSKQKINLIEIESLKDMPGLSERWVELKSEERDALCKAVRAAKGIASYAKKDGYANICQEEGFEILDEALSAFDWEEK